MWFFRTVNEIEFSSVFWHIDRRFRDVTLVVRVQVDLATTSCSGMPKLNGSLCAKSHVNKKRLSIALGGRPGTLETIVQIDRGPIMQ